jgi:hypothetical protein
MADTIDVTMPDGTIVYGVPRNITQKDLLTRLNAFKAASPAGLDKLENDRQLAAGTKSPGLTGIGAGLSNAKEGVIQGLAALGNFLGSDKAGEIEAKSRDRVAETNALMKPLRERSAAADASQFGGEVAPGFLFPASRGGALARVASEVASGAAQGAMSPLEPGQSRLATTAGGAIGAAVPAGVIGGVRALRNTGGHAQEMHELSRKFDVDLTAGELSGKMGLLRTETILEKVPYLGIGSFRKKQSIQVQNAAKKLRSQFDAGFTDVGEELQSGLNRVYETNKAEVGKLYDQVDRLSRGVKENVSPFNRQQLAADLLKEEAALGPNADQSLVKYLESHTSAEPMNFDAARKLRSRLWEDVRKAEKQARNGSVSDAEVRLRTQVAQALESDIDDWAERAGQQNKELLGAYRKASSEFRDKVAPFKDRDIRRALETDDTDTIIGTFLKRDRPKLADKLLSKTDERAQTAAKFWILDQAFQRAETVSPDIEFSPLAFASELERLRTTNKVVFTPGEQLELKGFVKLAQAAQRAGKFRENVPTGNRAVEVGALAGTAAMGALALKNPAMAATIAGGTKSLSLLLTSDVGRSILTDASRAGDRSPAMNRLLLEARNLVEKSTRATAAGAGSELSQ